MLVVTLRGVDLWCRRRWVKHPQHRESERGRVQVAQLDVAGVTVGCVGGPPLQDGLSAVGLAPYLTIGPSVIVDPTAHPLNLRLS